MNTKSQSSVTKDGFSKKIDSPSKEEERETQDSQSQFLA